MASALILFARIAEANNEPRLMLLWLDHRLIGHRRIVGGGRRRRRRSRRRMNRELRHASLPAEKGKRRGRRRRRRMKVNKWEAEAGGGDWWRKSSGRAWTHPHLLFQKNRDWKEREGTREALLLSQGNWLIFGVN